MVWRKYEGEGGWYGPGLHLAKSKNNRSHRVNVRARLWKCSREQMRMATEEDSLSKEVAMALSREVLDDVESGKPARFVDVPAVTEDTRQTSCLGGWRRQRQSQ